MAARRNVPELRDRDWLAGRAAQGRTVSDIARELGVSHGAVTYWYDKHQLTPLLSRYPAPELRSKGTLEELYHGQGLTQRDIAGRVGATQAQVSRAMKRLGVDTRPSQPARAHPLLHNRSWLHDRYVKQDVRQVDIAQELGVPTNAVRHALEQFGIETHIKPPPAADPRFNDRDWLHRRYVVDRVSVDVLAAEVGVGRVRMADQLRAFDIPVRSRGWTLPELVDDRDWLHRQRVEQGRSIEQIADIAKATASAVEEAFRRHSISDRWESRSTVHARLDDRGWLKEQLVAGRTVVGIADELGITTRSVSEAVRTFGLKREYPQLRDADWLHARYHGDGMRLVDIAELVGCVESAVSLAMADLGVPTRKNLGKDHPVLHDREQLTELFDEFAMADIAKQLGVSRRAVSKACHEFGLVRRRRTVTHPVLDDGEKLEELYETRSQQQLASELGVGVKKVRAALREHGIPAHGSVGSAQGVGQKVMDGQ